MSCSTKTVTVAEAAAAAAMAVGGGAEENGVEGELSDASEAGLLLLPSDGGWRIVGAPVAF
jgi:hypothetical protein